MSQMNLKIEELLKAIDDARIVKSVIKPGSSPVERVVLEGDDWDRISGLAGSVRAELASTLSGVIGSQYIPPGPPKSRFRENQGVYNPDTQIFHSKDVKEGMKVRRHWLDGDDKDLSNDYEVIDVEVQGERSFTGPFGVVHLRELESGTEAAIPFSDLGLHSYPGGTWYAGLWLERID